MLYISNSFQSIVSIQEYSFMPYHNLNCCTKFHQNYFNDQNFSEVKFITSNYIKLYISNSFESIVSIQRVFLYAMPRHELPYEISSKFS